MPPSTSSNPSYTPLSLATTTDTSSDTNTHIIIGVSVGAGCIVLFITCYRLWKCVSRRTKAPLPPKGPLALDRQRQMVSAHSTSDMDYPHSTVVPSHSLAPFSGPARFGFQSTDQLDDSSVPPSSPSVVSSQVHLVQTPTGSEENSDSPRPRRASFGSSSTARPLYHNRRQRTLSTSGSVHSSRSRQSSTSGTVRGRGPPHARHSRVDVVMPQPLAPGLYHGNSAPRQSKLPSYSPASSRERWSELGLTTGRMSMDSPSLMPTETHLPQHSRQYPPPVPPLPDNHHLSNFPTASPTVSSSEVISPTSAVPFLAEATTSPERSPPPLPPPKDRPSGSSSRVRHHSNPTHRNGRS